MLLDRVDIDAHGPLSRVELGPFSEFLNVICGPAGSGKTAITRFIRDSLVHREYPIGMMSSSTGRVVWAGPEGMMHCRREQDGSSTGRRTFEFEPRGDFPSHYRSLDGSWLGAIESSDSSRALRSIQIPESIVDGVITDTALTSVARVVSACIRSGLDETASYPSSGRNHSLEETERRRNLRRELADLETEIAQLMPRDANQESLLRRRETLTARLSRFHDEAPTSSRDSNRSVDFQIAELERRARVLQSEQIRLKERTEELSSRIASKRSETLDQHDSYRGHSVDIETRRTIDDLGAQLIRWRRTLREVRGLREALGAYAGQSDFRYPAYSEFDSPYIDTASIRRQRLDDFLHATRQYDHRRWTSDADWRPYEYRAADYVPRTHRWTSRDIVTRIESATRQIDWLIQRYAAADIVNLDWYSSIPSYQQHNSVEETLRAIRSDLVQVRGLTGARNEIRLDQERSRQFDLQELQQTERWLAASIDQLACRREAMLGDRMPRSYAAPLDDFELDRLQAQYTRLTEELSRTTLDLNDCLSRARHLRESIGTSGRIDNVHQRWVDREAIVAELAEIERQLESGSRIHLLRSRRDQLIAELGIPASKIQKPSTLAEKASHWLVRLTANRLQTVSWPYSAFKHASVAHNIHFAEQRTGICIDGRDESNYSDADRAIAALAVRMAAAEMLAASGRPVPLVLEIPAELLLGRYHGDVRRSAWVDSSYRAFDEGTLPICAALQDYSRDGGQVILLTSNETFADEIYRAGGRRYLLHNATSLHGHRSIWKPQYATEHFVGPPVYRDVDLADHRVSSRSRSPQAWPTSPHYSDINRSFDMAWREAYGFYDNPDGYRQLPMTDWAPQGYDYRDGYYVANQFTTKPQPTVQTPPAPTNLVVERQETKRVSPFFLTVDSPIDQAPSIDSIAAARLRNLSVTHINHLMQQDSNRLADALGLSNVDASTVRRWKAECRLVCRVPQLRGFDARVLVGCGITDPAQLASIPPVELLQRVEDFLTTKQGQRILLSGTSYELSRITSWIAAARSATDGRVVFANDETYARPLTYENEHDFDSDRYEYEVDNDLVSSRSRRNRSSRRSRLRNANQSRNNHSTPYGIVRGAGESTGFGEPVEGSDGSLYANAGDDGGYGNGSGNGRGYGNATGGSNANGAGYGNGYSRSSRSQRSRSNSGRSSSRSSRSNGSRSGSSRSSSSRSNRSSSSERQPFVRLEREPRERQEYERTPRDYTRSERDSSRSSRSSRSTSRTERSSRGERSERTERTQSERENRTSEQERELRFYLHRSSPIVDAPSIGAKMGDRLNAIGIHTVDDLLNADPEDLAAQLDHRRIDADTIVAWQQQATLVCRIPMLRGHDAQLLVAAEVTTPEEVEASDPDELFAMIDPISRSNEGKRILRGGKLPDLDEIKDWISFARQNRELMAA